MIKYFNPCLILIALNVVLNINSVYSGIYLYGLKKPTLLIYIYIYIEFFDRFESNSITYKQCDKFCDQPGQFHLQQYFNRDFLLDRQLAYKLYFW